MTERFSTKHRGMLEDIKREILLRWPDGVPVCRLARWLATEVYPEEQLASLIRSWAWPDRSADTGIELRGERGKRTVHLVATTVRTP